MTRRRPEARPATLQAWQVSLHVTASHRGLFWDGTTDKSMPHIEQGPINFSMIQPQTCKRIVCQAKNARLWRRSGFCCAAPPPPLIALGYNQSVSHSARPHSLHAVDATGRFHWQIAFSRWFFKPCWYFNYRIRCFILCSGSSMSTTTMRAHFSSFLFFFSFFKHRWYAGFGNERPLLSFWQALFSPHEQLLILQSWMISVQRSSFHVWLSSVRHSWLPLLAGSHTVAKSDSSAFSAWGHVKHSTLFLVGLIIKCDCINVVPLFVSTKMTQQGCSGFM